MEMGEEKILPMSLREGPPLPRFLGIKWPWMLRQAPGIYEVRMESFTKAEPKWDKEKQEMVMRSYHSIHDRYVYAETEDQARKRVSAPPDYKITKVERVREENGYYATSTSKILKELVELE